MTKAMVKATICDRADGWPVCVQPCIVSSSSSLGPTVGVQAGRDIIGGVHVGREETVND